MRYKVNIIILVPFLLALFSCNKKITLEKTKQQCIQINDFLKGRKVVNSFNIAKIDTTPVVYYFSKEDSCLNIKNIWSSSGFTKYKLKNVLKKILSNDIQFGLLLIKIQFSP